MQDCPDCLGVLLRNLEPDPPEQATVAEKDLIQDQPCRGPPAYSWLVKRREEGTIKERDRKWTKRHLR